MQIFIKTLTGKHIVFNVEPTTRIEDLKSLIFDKTGMQPDQQRLIFLAHQLEDGNTLDHYHVEKNSLYLMRRNKGGCCELEKPSKVVGFIENDAGKVISPIKPGKLSSRYIRNTNSSRVYKQRGGTCYAFAACSAYINTILRIYGSIEPPSFEECYRIACYNGCNGGEPEISIKLLENHFHYGICCETTKKSTILDAITLSVIVCFSTSQTGWQNVAQGGLTEKPKGKMDGWHAAIVEGYDFNENCLICKNSWGGTTAEPRFNLKPSATHKCYFTHVYFTLNSIRGKTNKTFHPNITKFTGLLNNFPVDCAWMDEKTATYTSDYVCEMCEYKEGPCNYIGYKIEEWIYIKLDEANPFKWPFGFLFLENPLFGSIHSNSENSFLFPFSISSLKNLYKKEYNLQN